MRPDELERCHRVQAGFTVLVDVHKGRDTELINWAKQNGCYFYIGDNEPHTGHKRSPLYNPYKVKKYGRTQVTSLYRSYLVQNPDLLAMLPRLRAHVLGCWCYPQPCHGDVIIEFIDRERAA
jgi:Domain of unknown function (DUF4326)